MKIEDNSIKIRLAIDNDFEAIFSIWIAGISNSFDPKKFDPKKLKTKFTSNFKNRNGIFNFWVAVDNDNNIWGWQSLLECFNHPFKEATYAESSTYISDINRFKGLGVKLLDYVLKEAEKSSLEYVIGFVATTNKAARKITKETGWIEVGQIPASKKNNNNIVKTILVRPV